MNYALPDVGCVGSSFRTVSGLYFDLLAPDPEKILLPDIALSLARQRRYLGHTELRPYSVAEHCLLAARAAMDDNLSPDCCFAILMHDAAETYTGDLIRPLKLLLGDAFKKIEAPIVKAIETRFQICFDDHSEAIHRYDFGMAVKEKYTLNRIQGDEPLWLGQDQAYYIDRPMIEFTEDEAYFQFVRLAVHLQGLRGIPCDQQ